MREIGGLLCCSVKNMEICAELRNVFYEEVLGGGVPATKNNKYSNQKDHDKAFFILSGEDRISEMNLPSFNNSGAFN
jgi:hypothetical protein